MKKIIFLFFLLSIFACQPPTPTPAPDDSTVKTAVEEKISQPIQVIGKTIEYRYGESIYHLTVDNDTQLHWECVQGEEKGVTGDEVYKLHRINDQTLFLFWIEENDLGVSQVLDFENGKVFTFLKRGEDVGKAEGNIRLIN